MTILDPRRIVNVAVQVLPLTEDTYPIVDRAIAAIAASGVKHEVNAMETVMEGPLDALLAAARAAQRRERTRNIRCDASRRNYCSAFSSASSACAKAAHLACFQARAQRVVTIVKIGDSVGGTTIEEKTAKYRE
ncbi:MAG: thiamine-binding protein [Anaerolineales bacterium]